MSETLLTVVAEMSAQPGKEEALRQALMACIEPTRAEEGCVQYDLHESTVQPGHFVFYENWTSAEALARHLATPHLAQLKCLVPQLVEGEPRILTFRRIA
ncbi:MAG: antibiotic biosynthesis monooxygenase [Acidobacteria bacterium]|nr:antibiotic biosynthesis monooxygenase [Acidobacteriota bacterium]